MMRRIIVFLLVLSILLTACASFAEETYDWAGEDYDPYNDWVIIDDMYSGSQDYYGEYYESYDYYYDDIYTYDNDFYNHEPDPTYAVKSDWPAAGSIVLYGRYEQDNDLSNGMEPIEWIVLENDRNTHTLTMISRYCIAVAAALTPRNTPTMILISFPLSIGSSPTNLPVCPFIAKVYFFPPYLMFSSQTGYMT